MKRLFSRTYSGAPDLNLLIEFARETTRARWPRSTYKKVGDVVWGMPPVDSEKFDIRLWFDGAKLLACSWFEPPMNLEFDIMPGLVPYEQIADEILEWGQSHCEIGLQPADDTIPRAWAMLGYDNVILTMALDSDIERVTFLKRRDYIRTEGFDVLYRRSLDDLISAPPLEPPLRLRHATEADLEARVDVHRDAWSVWCLSRATIENYRQLRNCPIYDPELDVVLEGATGRFLAYCIGWLDVANGFGHFEPVGCRPAFTGRGYARAVTIECMHRMQARGMRTALVQTASVNQRARVLYPACGFAEVDRAYHYTKRVSL